MRSAAKEILTWTAVGGGALLVARAVARLSRSITTSRAYGFHHRRIAWIRLGVSAGICP